MSEATALVAAFSGVAVILAALLPALANRSQVAFIKTLQEALTAERTERLRLATRVDDLERSDGEKDSRILVLTSWGMYSQEPVPRTPPPWQREGT